MRFLLCLLTAALAAQASAQPAPMQRIGGFDIDVTEVSVAQFQQFVQTTRTVTAAERTGGNTFEAGWEQRPGWYWRAPFGSPAAPNEPAVHVSFFEAQAFCKWAGKRLPTDAEWGEAAYTERRAKPSDGFVTGRSYLYPTGDHALGANCLDGCGTVKTVAHALSSRGKGHAEIGTTKRGVNGLYEMGANAWEWVDSGPGNEKRTRGGSWWYGPASMVNSHVQTKPAVMSAVYIGFRCARDAR